MTTAISSSSMIYLAKQGDELVLRQGENPNQSKHADQRVLIVGGGVTGLTVSIRGHIQYQPIAHNHVDRVGPSRRRIFSDRRV